MKRVVIESPYTGLGKTMLHRLINRWKNVRYARACMADSFSRGEAPIASHLLYTQPGILRDDVEGERRLGIDAGIEWGKVAEATAIYIDRGISTGMLYGEMYAKRHKRPIEYRSLDKQIDRILRVVQYRVHDSGREESRENSG